MSRLTAYGVILAAGAAGACGGGDAIVSSSPPIVTIVAGDNQSGTVSRPLAEPLTIAVKTSAGASVRTMVTWAVTSGSGTLSDNVVLTDLSGQASVLWVLGAAPGDQSVTATVSGAIGSPASFSANATAVPAPLVLRYDGTRWSTSLEDARGSRASLASIWGATSSAVFAVGWSCASQLWLRYDGTAWDKLPPNCLFAFAPQYSSVWGSSASDVFVVDKNVQPMLLGGLVYHYDGQNWTLVYRFPCLTGILCPFPEAVWSSSPTDAFVVGDGGIIAHYDGAGWNQQASPTTGQLNALWGDGPGGPVFSVGAGGTILYYDRNTWRTQASGTTQHLFAVWGTSASDVFAVGGGGTILHYDGHSWTPQNSGSTQALYAVWGSSGNDIFAVGDASTILHYDGTKWAAQTTTADMNLRGVWGSSPGNVFAVGGPR